MPLHRRVKVSSHFFNSRPDIVTRHLKETTTKSATTPVTPTTSAAKPATLRTAKLDGVTINFTGDKTRDKCAELLYDALASDSGAREYHHHSFLLPLPPLTAVTASELISQRAKAVEVAVFNAHGSDYRSKIRSLYVNLKDKNNPTLREAVVSGEISAEKFAVMSSAVSHPFLIVVVLAILSFPVIGHGVSRTESCR